MLISNVLCFLALASPAGSLDDATATPLAFSLQLWAGESYGPGRWWEGAILPDGRARARIFATTPWSVERQLLDAQRVKLTALVAALPNDQSEYRVGVQGLDLPVFVLIVQPTTGPKRRYHLGTLDVLRFPESVRQPLCALWTFLRILRPSSDALDPAAACQATVVGP